MKRGLVPRMLAASAVLAALVGVGYALLVVATRDLVHTGDARERSAQTTARANRLEKLILDLETGARGYLLTRRPVFLQPWKVALPHVKPDADAFVAAARDDAGQQKLAREIRRRALAYLHDYSEPLVHRAVDGRLAEARLIVATGEGKRRVDEIRALFGRFLVRQQELGDEHVRAAASEGSRAVTIGFVSLGVSFLLVLLFTGWLARAIVVPLRRLGNATHRLAAGDLGVRVDEERGDELGALAGSFNAMAESLQENRDELETQNLELEAQQTELERAVEELAEGKQRIESLHAFSQRMTAETELERLAEVVLRHFADEARSAVGTLYAAEDGAGLVLAAARGVDREALPPRIAADTGLPGRALAERRPVVVEHAEATLSLDSFGVPLRARHELQVPLFHADAPVAVIALGRTEDRPFGPWEVEELEHLTDQAAVALANALSLRRAVHLADVNRAVLDATVDAIRLVDRDGATVVLNRAMYELYALAGVEPIGDLRERMLAMAERTTDPAAYGAAVDELLSDPEREVTFTFTLAASGHSFVCFTSPVHDSAGERLGRIFTVRDVTAEREIERMKDDFVATVTHELRTPLTSIIGYLELVLDGEAGELRDEQRRFLGVVDRSAHRLLELVGDLLFVAQSEAGRLEYERAPVQLDEVVREAAEAARPVAEEKGLALSVDARPVPVIEGDAHRLRQVVDNLLSNAIKFTPTGGNVAVAVARGASAVVVEVTDSGIGIPESELPRLFERFFRASSATRHEIQGTGLGLGIAKTIVEAHGGRIEVASTEGVGTTFRIELPVRQKLELAA